MTKRQNQMRGEVLTAESPESEIWIDDHFQRVLTNLVLGFINAENQLCGLQYSKKTLESFNSDKKATENSKLKHGAQQRSRT